MMKPLNTTRDPKGFNSKIFKDDRSIRRAFIILGYSVNHSSLKVPKSSVLKFQKDYNIASQKNSSMGALKADGVIGKDTLNALEVAIRISKKNSQSNNLSIGKSWQVICGSIKPRKYAKSDDIDYSKTNFVEVGKNGTGKLRSCITDKSLRCTVVDFERHGDVVFAVVEVPPQKDLAAGCLSKITCPCVFLSE